MSDDASKKTDQSSDDVPTSESATAPDGVAVSEPEVADPAADDAPSETDAAAAVPGGDEEPGAPVVDESPASSSDDQEDSGASVAAESSSAATDVDPAEAEIADAPLPSGDESPAPPEAEVMTASELLQEPEVRAPSAEVKAVVEALIFASPEPITPKMLFKMLAEEPKEDVAAAIESLKADYESRPGLALVEVAGGYQIVTRSQLHEWVRRLFHERSTQKLTVQGLETLAVIAYKQPITAAEITEIRGVNTSGVLSTLLERHLIKIVGRKNVVGRPFLYATTKEFLIRFGLKDLTELPRIEDMAEALGFDPPAGLIERTPQEEILPLEESADGEQGTPPEES
jgi:segregation and condensation protein B